MTGGFFDSEGRWWDSLVTLHVTKALPRIPSTMRLRDKVGFVQHEGRWVLLGPVDKLPLGQPVTVRRWRVDPSPGGRLHR